MARLGARLLFEHSEHPQFFLLRICASGWPSSASFRPEDIERKAVFYNYQTVDMRITDREGMSVFYKDEDGTIFDTYLTYARGIDPE